MPIQALATNMGLGPVNETNATLPVALNAVGLQESHAILTVAENAVVHGLLYPISHYERAALLDFLV